MSKATELTDSSVAAGQRPRELIPLPMTTDACVVTRMTPEDFYYKYDRSAKFDLNSTTEPTDSSVAAGQKPLEMVPHLTTNGYILTALTSENSHNKYYKAPELTLEELQKEFKTLCLDYMENLNMTDASKAVYFCSKIIYEIEPQSRRVPRNSNKVWEFIIGYGEIENIVFVTHFKNQIPPYATVCGNLCTVLSIEEAVLLSMDTFTRISNLIYENKDSACLLTPIARASFNREVIEDFSIAYQVAPVTLISMINQSCQSSGQYLLNSDPNIAIAASWAITRNVKDESLRRFTIRKLANQYIAAGKVPSRDKMETAGSFAIGGMPAEFPFDELIKFNEVERKKNVCAQADQIH